MPGDREYHEFSERLSTVQLDRIEAKLDSVLSLLHIIADRETAIITKEQRMIKIIDKGMADVVLAVKDLEQVEERAEATISHLADKIAQLITPRTDPDTVKQINELLSDIGTHKASLTSAVATGEASLPVVTASGDDFNGTNGTLQQNADYAQGVEAAQQPETDWSNYDDNAAFQVGFNSIPAPAPADNAPVDENSDDYKRGVADRADGKLPADISDADKADANYTAGYFEAGGLPGATPPSDQPIADAPPDVTGSDGAASTASPPADTATPVVITPLPPTDPIPGATTPPDEAVGGTDSPITAEGDKADGSAPSTASSLPPSVQPGTPSPAEPATPPADDQPPPVPPSDPGETPAA